MSPSSTHSAPPAPQAPPVPRRAARVRQLLHFVRRDWREQGLVLHALGVVIVVRLGLSFWSYRGLREHLPRWFRRGRVRYSPEEAVERARRVAWAVERAASLVPRASCLTQAFAAQMLLSQGGQASRLHIGVAKNPETAAFEAHAWVEHEGRVIIGGTRRELSRYTPIAAFDG